jgi:hypothetical protein
MKNYFPFNLNANILGLTHNKILPISISIAKEMYFREFLDQNVDFILDPNDPISIDVLKDPLYFTHKDDLSNIDRLIANILALSSLQFCTIYPIDQTRVPILILGHFFKIHLLLPKLNNEDKRLKKLYFICFKKTCNILQFFNLDCEVLSHLSLEETNFNTKKNLVNSLVKAHLKNFLIKYKLFLTR